MPHKKQFSTPLSTLVDGVKAVGKPLIKKLDAGHKRGMITTRKLLGLFVCGKCGYHQIESFGVCPKCHTPRAGLHIPKNK